MAQQGQQREGGRQQQQQAAALNRLWRCTREGWAELIRPADCCRLRHLSVSRDISVHSSRVGAVKWLDLDPVEQRYLLAASADSSIEALDVLVGLQQLYATIVMCYNSCSLLHKQHANSRSQAAAAAVGHRMFGS